MTVLGLFAALAMIVILTRLKYSLGNGLLAGSLLLGLMARMTPADFLAAIWEGISDIRGLTLVGIVGLLTIVGQVMEMTGAMERMVAQFRRYLRSDRLALAAFPALIGLLPMPGGVIFSAPMVENLAKGMNLSGSHKAAINLWFRHVWEYSWPLYPALITISTLAMVPIGDLVRASSPMSLAAVVSGVIFTLRGIPEIPRPSTPAGDSPAQGAIWDGLAPVALVVVGAMVAPLLAARIKTWPNLAWVSDQSVTAASLAVSVLWAAWPSRRLDYIWKAVFSKHVAFISYFVAAVLVFKSVIIASGAIQDLQAAMKALNVPLYILVAGMTFIIGLVTGYAIAYVAAGFPIFLGMLSPEQVLPYAVLGHACGFAGVLLSPAHACLVLGNQYFNAQPEEFYKFIIWPTLLTMATGCSIAAWMLR